MELICPFETIHPEGEFYVRHQVGKPAYLLDILKELALSLSALEIIHREKAIIFMNFGSISRSEHKKNRVTLSR